MAQGPLGSLLRDIRRLYEDGAIGCQSDAQLLERFRSLGDRVAFEALVGRHGRMVLAVCREVLGDPTTPRMRSRRRSCCWPARPVRSGSAARSPAGCTGSATGSRSRPASRRADGGATRSGRPRWPRTPSNSPPTRSPRRMRADGPARRARPPARSAEDSGRALLPRRPELCRGCVAARRDRDNRARPPGTRPRSAARDRLGPPLVSSVPAVPPGLIALDRPAPRPA